MVRYYQSKILNDLEKIESLKNLKYIINRDKEMVKNSIKTLDDMVNLLKCVSFKKFPEKQKLFLEAKEVLKQSK